MNGHITILAIKRKKYLAQIFTYKQRRANLSRKISNWNREIKRLDEKRVAIEAVVEKVRLFSGVDVASTKGKATKEMALAKNLYYKLGLESGITGVLLMDFIGVNPSGSQAAQYRKRFNAKLVASPELRQVWANFKQYNKDKL